MSHHTPVQLGTDSFDEALRTDHPVVVDFWAEWCPPCRVLGPEIDALAETLGDSATVAKVDIEAHPELAERYGIQSIPTVLIFSGGEVVQRFVGIQTADALAEAVAEARAQAA